MRAAILLVDFQEDYLAAPGLRPPAPAVVERAAALLDGGRRAGAGVFHVRTTVLEDDARRLPHWKSGSLRRCVAGTPGHAPPPSLAPLPGEIVIDKTGYSAFVGGELEAALRSGGFGLLVLAGVHLHACVRTAALEAHERGFPVAIADDAVGSDDPVHAAITRRYLEDRDVRFAPAADLEAEIRGGSGTGRTVHRSPRDLRVLREVADEGDGRLAGAVEAAARARRPWAGRNGSDRAALLVRLAGELRRVKDPLAARMAEEIGKPRTMGAAEVLRAADLLEAVAARAADAGAVEASGPGSLFRRMPFGSVAAITPWNNPVAVPLGKIAPLLLHGNGVVWKPAPAGTGIAEAVLGILESAGLPPGLVSIVRGGDRTARRLAGHPGIDAVTLTGGEAAGLAIGEVCLRLHRPLQAELGGNNGAVVWDDADLPAAAGAIASGAFGFAGQRCTANRRAIVSAGIAGEFIEMLAAATAGLRWGDPLDAGTVVGPLISASRRDAVERLLARHAGPRTIVPHRDAPGGADLRRLGAYLPPAIVVDPDRASEIVQEETFGPVLVVQVARSFDEALALLDGVRQGLAAALFSASPARRARFLREVRAGILKLDRSTVDADAVSPFGGWKASGMGPPEHGAADRESCARIQTVYGIDGDDLGGGT